MKIKNLNLTLEWQTVRNIPDYIEVDRPFPTYNVKIKNKNDILIYQNLNLDSYEPIIEFSWDKDIDQRWCKKTKFQAEFLKNRAKNIFQYNFENNYLKYKELENEVGFYKELKFEVDYNNDGKGDFKLEAEYDEIEDLNKDLLFNKIYRSSDYLTIKLLINKDYFKQKNIYSFLITSNLSNKLIKNQDLSNLFTENIESKWLDVNETTALLTVPFIESDIVEISENLNVKIIPLNYLQSEIYNFLKLRETEKNINIFYNKFFPNQVFNVGKIYKQAVNNEMLIFYQNYIYLFNNQSITTNALNTINISEIEFNRYYPLLNKDQNNKTICLSDDLNTDEILDNSYNLQKDYLGYYDKNLTDYEDVAIDLDYLQNQGISKVKIYEVEEIDNICNIYIEFITNFCNNERFYIQTSSNLKFYEKYKTTIDDKDYITFLFKYSYNLDSLNIYLENNSNQNKSQIISDKDLINFSAKLIF